MADFYFRVYAKNFEKISSPNFENVVNRVVRKKRKNAVKKLHLFQNIILSLGHSKFLHTVRS